MKNTIVVITLILSACLLAAKPQQVPTVDGIVYLSEFASLQDAVTAVPNGGTVIVPRGVWEGDAVIPDNKYVHLQGVSPAMMGQSPALGSTQWDYLLVSYPQSFLNGSILRGHITATGNAAKLSMTNIIMIGHGEGIGIDLGNTSQVGGYGGVYDNVDIGNYEIGMRAEKTYNLTINKMRIYGVGTGLSLKNGNLIRLRDVDIINCTLGADLKGVISWTGGSVQSCQDGVVIWQMGGYMGNVYFEEIAGNSLVFDGYGGHLDPNYYASNSGKLIIKGYNNVLDLGWTVGTPQFTSTARNNFVTLWGGEYVDGGYQNRITQIKNIGTPNLTTVYVDRQSGQHYMPDGVIINSTDGRKYRLTVTNGVLGIVEVK